MMLRNRKSLSSLPWTCLFLIITFFSLTNASKSEAYELSSREKLNLNRNLIRVYGNAQQTRMQQGENQMPRTVNEGISSLQADDIPVFRELSDVLTIGGDSIVQHFVLQEYLRSQIDWGMPWLPLSWTTRLRHLENDHKVLASTLEQKINNLSHPLSSENIFTYYLFTHSYYHTGEEHLVEKIRKKADVLGQKDKNFWDIRVEIHQEPTLLTLARLEKYIQETDGSNKSRAEKIHEMLKKMFGATGIEDFFKAYDLDADLMAAFHNVIQAMDSLKNIKVKKSGRKKTTLEQEVTKKLDSSIIVMNQLADQAIKYYEKLRLSRSSMDCINNKKIDCNFEIIDLLRQVQNTLFSMGNILIDRIMENEIQLSIMDILRISRPYIAANVSTGIMRHEFLEELEEIIQNQSGRLNSTLPEIKSLMARVEKEIPESNRRIRGIFLPLFEQYKDYVPEVERFVDENLRSSGALPLSNLLAHIRKALSEIEGSKIQLGSEKIPFFFRPLNPGIAKGKIIIPDPDEITKKDFYWDPEGIYVLIKTPAEVHKIAAILTTDSGSMISHVQLLALNHGIPNIHISKNLAEKLREWEGKEVILEALPNDEVIIKEWENADSKEIETYNRYNQVKQKHKIDIKIPASIDTYNYPIRLSALRMVDQGVVAGGKACGQGELSSIFPGMVPKGIVLPFGVYWEHINKNGLYDEIRNTLSSDDVQGSSEEAFNKRAKAFEKIRDSIMKMPIDKNIISYLKTAFESEPFKSKGVFVRSDTNAEDLKGFVGAGLNKTVPNVVGLENVLKAVKTVWASPFTEKAFTWRNDLIQNPWDILPSVIIQVGISSTKAGIMITGSHSRDDAVDTVFIAANEGVGITAVNGEYTSEELEYSRSTGKVKRLRKSYAPKRISLGKRGGILRLPVLGLDPIVTENNAKQLAAVATKIQNHLSSMNGEIEKWDMEWGIVRDVDAASGVKKDKVILFQIRHFIGNKIVKDLAVLKDLQTAEINSVLELPVNDRHFILRRKVQ